MKDGMRHGGDIDGARALFGEPDGGWLDLSTGINPDAYPVLSPSRDAWVKLPQSGAEQRLLEAARSAYGVRGAADLCCAPGTQVLIQLAARLRPGARVSIVGPTYAEHARTWAAEGCPVTTVASIEHVQGEVAVLVNPNNPDGRVIEPDVIIELSRRLASRDGLVVVDEAFADAEPKFSVVTHAERPGLLVLRSFGKFFGLAGIRLGFAIGSSAEIGRLRSWLGPWATSGPALEIGAAALADAEWIARTRAELATQAMELATLLDNAGLRVIGGAGLFTLASHPAALDLHAALARRGVWTRRFDDHPQWLRFGLPGRHAGRLAAALAEACRDVGAPT